MLTGNIHTLFVRSVASFDEDLVRCDTMLSGDYSQGMIF